MLGTLSGIICVLVRLALSREFFLIPSIPAGAVGGIFIFFPWLLSPSPAFVLPASSQVTASYTMSMLGHIFTSASFR